MKCRRCFTSLSISGKCAYGCPPGATARRSHRRSDGVAQKYDRSLLTAVEAQTGYKRAVPERVRVLGAVLAQRVVSR